MRAVANVTFIFDGLSGAQCGAAMPVVSDVLDDILRKAPGFAKCYPHGVYRYRNSLGVHNTIRIEADGLFVIMHDGRCFGRHPLIEYLHSALLPLFPDARFETFDA
jgi:hypothetical protein